MEKHWFRRRKGLFTMDMGYGWMPIAWQGWALVMLTIMAAIGLVYLFQIQNPDNVWGFLISLVSLLVGAVMISDLKCDRPYFMKVGQ